MNSPRVLRPLGSLEQVNEALDLLKRTALSSLAIPWVLNVPLWAAAFAFIPESGPGLIGAWTLLLAPFVIHAAVVKAQFEWYLGREFSVLQAWLAVVRRAAPLALTLLMLWLALAAGSVALFLPMLYLHMGLFFLPHAVMIEETSAVPAFRRSWELVRGHRGRMFVVSLLAALPWMMLLGLLFALGAETESTESSETITFSAMESLLSGLLAGTFFSLFSPFSAALSVVSYVDQRVRKEGFDIDCLARGAGLTAAPGSDGEQPSV